MISKRLAALESKLIRPPDAKPVDLGPVRARIMLAIVAHRHGRQRPGRSILEGFARAMRCTPDKLWRLAHADRKRFRKRLACVDARADVDAMADAIVREFMAEETTYRLIEACIAETGQWLANMMGPKPWPGLCRQRPLAEK